MAENLRLARLYMVILAILATLRWLMGTLFQVPYEKATDKVSIVIVTLVCSLLYAAFTRRFRGYRMLQAVTLGMTLGLLAQLVIFVSTVASYALGISSYFNHPTALNQAGPVPLQAAVLIRLGGLVSNTLACGVAGALGFVLGAALPADRPADRQS